MRGLGAARARPRRTVRQRGSGLAGTQGRSEAAAAAAMLPSLQESLDGDEKELESSEEGGPAEERRPEPPPSSHYCLYSYRGSRCSARVVSMAPPRPRISTPHLDPASRPWRL